MHFDIHFALVENNTLFAQDAMVAYRNIVGGGGSLGRSSLFESMEGLKAQPPLLE